MKRLLRTSLMLLLAAFSCAALSGTLPAGGLDAAGAPWDAAGPFPSRYDLRGLELVTPVRSQQGHGTCWAMAALGSLESGVLRSDGRAYDFSENNLANHMSSRLDYEGYAPSEITTAYLARWEGPVLERDDPYPRPGRSPDLLRGVRRVAEVLSLPRRRGSDDNAAVKWAVSTYGGIDAAIDFDTNDEDGFWNASTASYCSSRDELDHHVTCVGWDDAYPASRFATRPPGDGAFLIKNSWGTEFGESGYFWLSYHDAGFGRALTVYTGATAHGLDAIYQHDALGRSTWLGFGADRAWFAARYRCAGSGRVAAVALYTPVPGSAYEIRVAGSVAGVATARVAATGTIPVAGYHTVRLTRPVTVARGDVFIVAARLTTPGWSRPIALEHPSELIAPRARVGQSYVSFDGRAWKDLASRPGYRRSSVCLKAFVSASGAGDRRSPRVAVAAGRVRRGGTATVRWALADPGFSSAGGVVVIKVTDARGRLMAERRIPAVAVGERGTWSFTASWRPGRYTVGGQACDVAGHRQRTTSRATLTIRAAHAADGRTRPGH